MYSFGMNLYIFGGIFLVLWVLRRLLRLTEGRNPPKRPRSDEYDWLDYTIGTEIGKVPKGFAFANWIFGGRKY